MRFTERELEQLKSAVAHAEAQTSAEIVPVIVPASDPYPVAVWRGASAGVVISIAAIFLAYQFYAGWGLAWAYTGWGAATLVLVCGAAGWVAGAFIPTVRRLLIGQRRMAMIVHLRAMQAFVEEEVFATRERTGILLFISLFEHRIEIVADTEINNRIKAEEWGEIVARIREGIRSGALYEGLVDAFALCSNLLERKGPEIRTDDRNELSDEIRLRRKP